MDPGNPYDRADALRLVGQAGAAAATFYLGNRNYGRGEIVIEDGEFKDSAPTPPQNSRHTKRRRTEPMAYRSRSRYRGRVLGTYRGRPYRLPTRRSYGRKSTVRRRTTNKGRYRRAKRRTFTRRPLRRKHRYKKRSIVPVWASPKLGLYLGKCASWVDVKHQDINNLKDGGQTGCGWYLVSLMSAAQLDVAMLKVTNTAANTIDSQMPFYMARNSLTIKLHNIASHVARMEIWEATAKRDSDRDMDGVTSAYWQQMWSNESTIPNGTTRVDSAHWTANPFQSEILVARWKIKKAATFLLQPGAEKMFRASSRPFNFKKAKYGAQDNEYIQDHFRYGAGTKMYWIKVSGAGVHKEIPLAPVPTTENITTASSLGNFAINVRVERYQKIWVPNATATSEAKARGYIDDSTTDPIINYHQSIQSNYQDAVIAV